ncbi:MAG: hypothetical protein ICV64_12780 [Thermoleophilia bacterium]|nr:hypothetical protein [Thermoleophilia bacterium]
MARRGKAAGATPPPLPHDRRPIGQLIAEAIRLYQRRFWASLALGLVLAARDQLAYGHDSAFGTVLLWAFGPLLSAAYVAACAISTDARPPRRAVATAITVGILVYLPFPLLIRIFILPGLAWFALFGLAVPAALHERLRFRGAIRRGFELGRADFVHALGGLAALVLVYGVASSALVVLLRSQGDQAARAALFLADLVLSPLVFLGAALLYFDQAARVVDSTGPRTRRSGDADLLAAVEPDAAGRPDAEVEPRPAAPGQQ